MCRWFELDNVKYAARSEGYREGWNAALEAAADVAQKHKGAAAKLRGARGQRLGMFDEHVQIEIQAEERGEDIAADVITRNIRALMKQEETT